MQHAKRCTKPQSRGMTRQDLLVARVLLTSEILPLRKIQAPRADEDEDDDDANPLLDFFEKVPFCGDKIIENLGLAE